MLTVTEKAQNRLNLIDRYTQLHQASASYYHRQSMALSELELREQLHTYTMRMQQLAIEHAVYADLLQNAAPYERCIEEARDRVAATIQELLGQATAKAKEAAGAAQV
jgi:hypothetical protein